MTFLTTVTNNGSPIATALFLLLTIAIHWIPLLILFILLVKALIKYLRTGEIRKEKAATRKNLGEALKEQRLRCQMTQEFVAERLSVSRQAVSKWENGTSDPSTSNLLALAKLYGISAETLLQSIDSQ